MDYFLLKQMRNLGNIISPVIPSIQDIWSSDKPVFIPGTTDKPEEFIYFLPFIESTQWMISDEMKKTIEIYQNKTLYRACALGNVESRLVKIYWFIMPKTIACFYEHAMYDRIVPAKDFVLSKEKIGYNKVFQLDTRIGNYFIVDTEVLEALLRADITEFQITLLQSV